MTEPKLTVANLETYINWYEHSYDDGTLQPSDTKSIENKLDRILNSDNTRIDNDKIYLLYELIGLVLFSQGRIEESNNSLEIAYSLMVEGQTFVSMFANTWIEKVSNDIATAESERQFQAEKQLRQQKRNKIIVSMSVGVIIILSFVGTPIANYFTLKSAESNILQLSSEAGLNKNGELFLLRTHPTLIDDATLTKNCGDSGSDGFIEQGCYLPSTSTIYLRKMTDDLHGLEVVTAAHEALHAVYHGLSSSEQAKVNKMVEDEYASINDKKFSDRMAAYDKSEPGAKDDELHSILGTEYADLSPELENYYAKYFDNRSTVVSSKNDVDTKFTALEDQLNSYDAKITAEQKNADALYNAHVYAAENGDSYAARIDYQRYTDVFNATNTDIGVYNSTLDQYKQLAAEFDGKQFSSKQSQTISSSSN